MTILFSTKIGARNEEIQPEHWVMLGRRSVIVGILCDYSKALELRESKEHVKLTVHYNVPAMARN